MAFGHEGDQLHLPYYLESMLEVINVVLVVRTEGPLHAHLVELAEALEVLGDEVAFTIVDMLFGQIICLLVCAIQLINIETVSENKIEKSGVVFVLPAANHRSSRFEQWLTSEPDLCITSYQKNPVVYRLSQK